MNEPAEHLDILKHGTQAELFPDLQAGVPETWQMETLRVQLEKMQKQLDDVTEAGHLIADAVLKLCDASDGHTASLEEVQKGRLANAGAISRALSNLNSAVEQHTQQIKDLQVLTLDIKP